MDIIQASPVTTRDLTRPVVPYRNVSFTLIATLSCPICQESETVETNSMTLYDDKQGSGTLTKPQHYVDNAIRYLSKPRQCQVCGVVSGVPRRQMDKLSSRLYNIVTKEWIQKRLIAQPVVSPVTQMEHDFAVTDSPDHNH